MYYKFKKGDVLLYRRKSESVITEVQKLPEILYKEWYMLVCNNQTEDITDFEDFKKLYNNFEGTTIEEFLDMPENIYWEWCEWREYNNLEVDFNEKTFTEVWDEFKEFWQYNSEESKVMFKEMDLLSESMTQEWRLKYNFVYPHVYEENYQENFTNYRLLGDKLKLQSELYDEFRDICRPEFLKKTKAQLWEEFKDTWQLEFGNKELDLEPDLEFLYNERVEYIEGVKNDFLDIPIENYDFDCDRSAEQDEFKTILLDNFDKMSVLMQYDICEKWQEQKEQIDSRDFFIEWEAWEKKEQEKKELEIFIKENNYVWNSCVEDYDTYIKNIQDDFNEYKNCSNESENEDLVDYNSEEVKRIIYDSIEEYKYQNYKEEEDFYRFNTRHEVFGDATCLSESESSEELCVECDETVSECLC